MPGSPQAQHGTARSRAAASGPSGPLPREAGTVIVGGGLAGVELATALAEQGAEDVVLLEAGPGSDLAHIHLAHPQAAATEIVFAPERDPYFHGPGGPGAPHYTGISGLRRRLGGRSLYWHGVVLPLEDWALHPPGWPAEIVAELTTGVGGAPSWYDRVTEQLTDWSGGGLWDPAQPARTSIGGQEFRALPRACRRRPGTDRWEAYTALDAWRGPDGDVTPPAGVRVHCDTEVLAVDVRGGRARGVLVRLGDGDVSRIAAHTVVLSAGTVESTRLAALALTDAGALPSPRLGGLADHIVQGFVVRLPADRLPPPGSYHLPTDPVLRSYLRVDVHDDGPGRALLDVRVTGEQLPNEGSVVECEPSDEPFPRASCRTGLLPEDHKMISGQRDLLRDFWAATARELGEPSAPLEFTGYGDTERDNTRVLPDRTRSQSAGRPETWSSLLGTEDHEGGSLRSGGCSTPGTPSPRCPVFTPRARLSSPASARPTPP
uniref:NADH:N-amidino-scyllo-inosamine oxidoreductase n=1 Tax=Streptomyces griseus TaxID=1911 RepID=P72455_STRGR|nr:NADH:N-amidino-scyllo-inosamine oxidoreductase [Streptomyces griseus]